MMKKFCTKTGLDQASLRFCFDGRRLKDDETPRMVGALINPVTIQVELEEGDIVEVYQEQSGGGLGGVWGCV